MKDHRFVSKVNKRLRDTECQWPQPCPKPSNENKCLHCNMLLAFPVDYMVRILQQSDSD